MITTRDAEGSLLGGAATAVRLPVTLDTEGRIRTSQKQRDLIVAEFDRSSLTAAQFARRTGLKYSTFIRWLQHRRPDTQPSVRLVEAIVAPPVGAPLRVQLPGGAHLEICEVSQIRLAAALVQALEKSC